MSSVDNGCTSRRMIIETGDITENPPDPQASTKNKGKMSDW
ncbi:MAG: hypothetical protein ACTSUE_20885 [Promethearchaeota archaeon]